MKVLLILSALLLPIAGWATEKIKLYTQYDYPPFYYTDGHGLTQVLARELSEHSQGRYQFEVVILPRKRLDLLLEDPQWQGIIPWVSPVWFRDESKTRFAWSASLMLDADLVVSHQPILFDSPNHLVGKTLGGILGHRYAELESLIAAGKIIRDDAPNQELNLKKLQAKRVDFLFIPQSSWSELNQTSPAGVRGLHIANKPRNIYERQILISPNHPALVKYIQHAVSGLSTDSAWQQKIRVYSYQANY